MYLTTHFLSVKVAVLQKQQDERRKARLIQVREQDRGLARRVRQGVHGKRELEKCILESHLQAALASDHQRELRELEARYLAKTGELGQAHRAAQNTMQVASYACVRQARAIMHAIHM